MLFSSYEFIFVFLPLVLLGYLLLGWRASQRSALVWLILCSLVYYGWSKPIHLSLLGFSIVFNFAIGTYLGKQTEPKRSRLLVAIGIIVNLGLLGYFKYSLFAVETASALLHTNWTVGRLALPIGISFFTFQQIAYLVDRYRHQIEESDFVDYCFFVMFFPKLIAGPLVRYNEISGQLHDRFSREKKIEDISVGVTITVFGLFKKVIIADTIAKYVSQVFAVAGNGVSPTFAQAWIAAMCYTFQLYFDFSGYTDMAIGISRIFGITLPLNFHSPYKAVNIVDFWRRWHVTLARFLRDYLYIPLGGNRKGLSRQYVNLMATMLVCGLWHGAGWTFVFWGGLHGAYLAMNHGWLALRKKHGFDTETPSWYGKALGRVVTFAAVVFGWVFFRAQSFSEARIMLGSMFGLNGLNLDAPGMGYALLWAVCLLIIVWFFPNTQEVMARFRPLLEYGSEGKSKLHLGEAPSWLRWRPILLWAVATAVLAVFGVLGMSQVTEFIYFAF